MGNKITKIISKTLKPGALPNDIGGWDEVGQGETIEFPFNEEGIRLAQFLFLRDPEGNALEILNLEAILEHLRTQTNHDANWPKGLVSRSPLEYEPLNLDKLLQGQYKYVCYGYTFAVEVVHPVHTILKILELTLPVKKGEE